jgi:DNA-binding MarR family transcriptional regulator
LCEFRRLRSRAVPFLSDSAIGFALLEEALRATLLKEELSVKALFGAAGFSDIGMRYQFSRLVERGLLRLSVSKRDRRMKVVHVTKKTLEIYDSIFSETSIALQESFKKMAVNDSSTLTKSLALIGANANQVKPTAPQP